MKNAISHVNNKKWLALGFFLLSVTAVNVNSSEVKELVAQIKALNDSAEFAQAKILAETARANHQSVADLFYESARAEMSKVIETDDVLLYRYPEENAQRALKFIEYSVSSPDSDGRAYSLALHLHTQMRDKKRADEAIAQFKKIAGDNARRVDPWFEVNLGVYQLWQNNLPEAYSAFYSSKNSWDRRIRYRAWRGLSQIRQLAPQYELGRLVNNGAFKRVEIHDLRQYVQSKSGKRPLLILISSDDKGCGYCRNNNQLIEEIALDNRFEYIYVSVEPWQQISMEPELRKRYFVTGLPQTMIAYKGEVISYKVGAFSKQTQYYRYIDRGYAISQGNAYDRLEDMKGWQDLHLRSDQFLGNLQWYQSKTGFRALAFAFSNGTAYYGWGVQQGTQAKADAQALKSCEKHRDVKKVNNECILLLQGGKIVLPEISDKTKLMVQRDIEFFRRSKGEEVMH